MIGWRHGSRAPERQHHEGPLTARSGRSELVNYSARTSGSTELIVDSAAIGKDGARAAAAKSNFFYEFSAVKKPQLRIVFIIENLNTPTSINSHVFGEQVALVSFFIQVYDRYS